MSNNKHGTNTTIRDNNYYKNLYSEEIKLYTPVNVRNMQTAIFPFLNVKIHRIFAPVGNEVCSQCQKQASFFKVDDESFICWKHGNEINKS